MFEHKYWSCPPAICLLVWFLKYLLPEGKDRQ